MVITTCADIAGVCVSMTGFHFRKGSRQIEFNVWTDIADYIELIMHHTLSSHVYVKSSRCTLYMRIQMRIYVLVNLFFNYHIIPKIRHFFYCKLIEFRALRGIIKKSRVHPHVTRAMIIFRFTNDRRKITIGGIM